MDVKDSNGNVLKDGDSVILIKDLKVKGAGQTLKHGTKSRSFASPIMKTKLIATTKKSKAWCCALSS